jgi:hypothetical protein
VVPITYVNLLNENMININDTPLGPFNANNEEGYGDGGMTLRVSYIIIPGAVYQEVHLIGC